MTEHQTMTPDGTARCPQCGTPVAMGAVAGLCPACLLKLGAMPDTVADGKHGAFQPPPVAALAACFPGLEILELIGKGGMGAVYRARQRALDRVVALKVLPPGIGADPAFAERFAREAKALARLNHPGIVTLYEFGQVSLAAAGGGAAAADPRESSLCYFLMEYVDGVNLRQLLQSGRLSPREALAVVPQICDALQYAHDQGIVHRDIKPENILLDRRGRVKVADFGLAKIMTAQLQSAGSPDPAVSSGTPGASTGAAGGGAGSHALTAADNVLGTPNYMAPEQVDRPGEVDHRADIYALGVVFYQMLTGELPGQPLEPPSRRVRVDVRLDEVVLRALETKPELRYQQASALKGEVETIASTVPPAGAEPGDAGRPPGVFQRFFQAVLPGRWFDAMRRESQGWKMVCRTCGYSVSVWAVGGIRFGARGNPRRLLRCPHCRRFRVFTTVWDPTAAQATGGSPARPAAGAGGPLPDPLPTLDFWQALEAGDYGRAWDRAAGRLQHEATREDWVKQLEQSRRTFGRAAARETMAVAFLTPNARFEQRVLTTFAGGGRAVETVICAVQSDGSWRIERYEIQPAGDGAQAGAARSRGGSALAGTGAVLVLLLLAASGNAVVMLVGAALLLALGLTWKWQRGWRTALLVALAGLGVATTGVVLLLRGGLLNLERVEQAAGPVSAAGWTDQARLDQVIGLGEHGSASHGDDAFRFEVVFDRRAVALRVTYRQEPGAVYRVVWTDKRGGRRLLAEGGLTSVGYSRGGEEIVEERKMLPRAEFERMAALILQRREGAAGGPAAP